MLRNDEEFLINELARRTNTTPRTIRFYLAEGLLPQPEIRGKYAYFSEEYVDRLELIRRLKDAYLPLREIAERIRGMSANEVKAALAELDQRTKSSAPFEGDLAQVDAEPPKPSSKRIAEQRSTALDYIHNVLNAQEASRSLPSRPAPAAPQHHGETWQRHEIVPGVEIHVHEPADPSLRSAIAALIDFAHRTFRKRA